MSIQNSRLTATQYEQNFSDIHPPFETKDAALVEANRCLFCYDAPVPKAVLMGIDVPKFIKQITTDNIKGSARTIFSSNIMGAVAVKCAPCRKLCEGSCVYNSWMKIHTLLLAATLFHGNSDGEKWQLFTRKSSTGKKVAVVVLDLRLSCAHVL